MSIGISAALGGELAEARAEIDRLVAELAAESPFCAESTGDPFG